jgi:aspartate/methionine/tyrosine aminotransferase
MRLDPQAEQLNQAIESVNPSVMRMLSRRGCAIYFPSKGIIQQSADAKSATINATIGTALDDDGGPMSLDSLRERVKLPPAQAFLYAPPKGREELRDLWERNMRQKNPSLGSTPTSKPVVTLALTHGLSMVAYLFVDEGDEVILPDLYWENYNLLFEHAYGGQLTTFPMFAGEGFNVEGLRATLRRKAEFSQQPHGLHLYRERGRADPRCAGGGRGCGQ